MAFWLSKCLDEEIHRYIFKLRAQGTIETQFLKSLSALRTFEKSPMWMTNSTDSILRR